VLALTRTALWVACLSLVSLSPTVGAAQDARPEAVAAASAAFREGQSAQLAGDYARAAEMFELADDSAPSPAALRSAIRNRRAAGHNARAASLGAEAIARYPDDAETREVADSVIALLGPALGHVTLRCEPACTAVIDGHAVQEHTSSSIELYVDPGSHTVVASWAGREPVTQTFELAAGASTDVRLDAPAMVGEAEADPGLETESERELMAARVPIDVPPRDEPSRGITPIVFGALLGLTAVSGGVLIWSGVDVLDARDVYVAGPTMARYEDGLSREVRTNVLIGVTSGFAIGTLIVALFTDFGGDDAGDSAGLDSFMITPMPDGGALSASGRF
jgi:hypothetical protein